jgi:hypothetical protein
VDVGVKLTRIGPAADGGYLVPEDFESINTLYSPGVADSAGFDYEIAEMGMTCLLLDYSVDKPPAHHPNFIFSKRFLGPFSHGNYVSLTDWVGENCHEESDLFLQMDIEGAEWGVLAATPSEVLSRFRIMVVEFHDLASQIANPKTCEAVETLLVRLREHFDILHIHPNNCREESSIRGIPIPPVIEATFLRRDRAREEASPTNIPHELDAPNVPGNREPKVPKIWTQTSSERCAIPRTPVPASLTSGVESTGVHGID